MEKKKIPKHFKCEGYLESGPNPDPMSPRLDLKLVLELMSLPAEYVYKKLKSRQHPISNTE